MQYILTENGYIQNKNDKRNPNKVVITTSNYNELQISKNNKVFVIDENNNILYKNVDEVCLSDKIITILNTNKFNNVDLSVDLRKYYLIGLLYANLWNFDDIKDIHIEFLYDDIYNYLGDYLYRFCEVNKINNKIICNPNKDFMEENIIRNDISQEIFNGSIEIQMEFLKGFFDFNTDFTSNGLIKNNIKNLNIIRKISLMLKNLGIFIHVDKSIDSYSVIIKNKEIINYYSKIGFANEIFEEETLNISLTGDELFDKTCMIQIEDKIYFYENIIKIEETDELENYLNEECIINTYMCN